MVLGPAKCGVGYSVVLEQCCLSVEFCYVEIVCVCVCVCVCVVWKRRAKSLRAVCILFTLQYWLWDDCRADCNTHPVRPGLCCGSLSLHWDSYNLR